MPDYNNVGIGGNEKTESYTAQTEAVMRDLVFDIIKKIEDNADHQVIKIKRVTDIISVIIFQDQKALPHEFAHAEGEIKDQKTIHARFGGIK